MTTGGPGSTRTCHIPSFNTNLKATNAVRMWEAGGYFSKRSNAGKEVDGKRGQKEKWKSGEMGSIIIGTTKGEEGTTSVVHHLALCQCWQGLHIMRDMEQ